MEVLFFLKTSKCVLGKMEGKNDEKRSYSKMDLYFEVPNLPPEEFMGSEILFRCLST